MPDAARMIAAIETYCRAETEGDWDAFISLFAEGDVLHEDPVGYARRHGRAGLEEIWRMAQAGKVNLELTDKVIVCGNEAIAMMRAETGPEDERRVTGPIVDHFVFDGDGKITSVRAFYNF
jgi:steroid delta-isomerase